MNAVKDYDYDIMPFGNRILVKRQYAKREKTEGGIFLPDSVKDKEYSLTGTVLAVGPECEDIKPGMKILFSIYTGTNVYDDDDKEKYQGLVIMKEDSPLAYFIK